MLKELSDLELLKVSGGKDHCDVCKEEVSAPLEIYPVYDVYECGEYNKVFTTRGPVVKTCDRVFCGNKAKVKARMGYKIENVLDGITYCFTFNEQLSKTNYRPFL